MAVHNQIGKWGEEYAAKYLENKGYSILERDWHSGHRDVDIIAHYGDDIVFVEVKTRRSDSFVDPLQAIDYNKLHNLRIAIDHYVKSHNINLNVRFDVISIVGLNESDCRVNHLEDVNLF